MVNIESELIQYAPNEIKHRKFFEPYESYFSIEKIKAIQMFQQSHPSYEQTPLHSLTHLAKYLQVNQIYVKDESYRFGLNAFKVLGGIYAVGQYLADQLDRTIDSLSFNELQSSDVKEELGPLTFITATDGNHGRGVAWAARELGQSSVVYMPQGASEARVKAIENEGATVEVVNGNYDYAVQLAAEKAKEKGWIVLQDTSWGGYEQIPQWIMQGYASLALEITDQLDEGDHDKPTHVFLQVGVGSFAAAIAAFLTTYYGDQAPKIILVEPDEANCYYKSYIAREENYEIVGGDLATIMAGLSCGKPNPQSWEILKGLAEGGISADDKLAALGMRVLGHPLKTDPQIISGESGAATLGTLFHLMTDRRYEQLRKRLKLNEQAKVLLISTEGDTDKRHYKRVVWEGLHSIR